MQQSKVLETWVGLFVILGMVALFFLSMKVSNLADLQVKDDSYRLVARFQNVGGLRVRSAVSMAGVRIGRVSAISFDTKTYDAVVEMHIEPQYNTIPEDTTANILTAGLLGEQYIGLSPGASDDFLKDGDEIELSQSALVLEEVISRFLFNKAESSSENKQPATSSASEDRVEPVHLVDDEPTAKPKPQVKTQDKTANSKPKPATLPKTEKSEAVVPAHKLKEGLVKPAEDAHAGQKTKGAAAKARDERDADHKSKPAAR